MGTEIPSSIKIRPLEEIGVVIQLAAEAGSDTKLIVPANMESMDSENGYRDLVMGGLEAIASGRFGEHGYHGVSPDEAAGVHALFFTTVE